jgi:hypothetical protein
VPPPSSTRARRLPSLALLAVVCTPYCPRSRSRVGAFAFTRASAQARRPRASVHPSTRARQPGRQGWTFGSFSCAGPRGCAPVGRAAIASPLPDASRTQSQGRERRSLGRRVHASPPAAASSHVFVPTAVALPAATHGASLSSAAATAVPPPFQPTPSLSHVVPHTCVRTQAHSLAHVFTRLLTGKGTRTTSRVLPPRRRRCAHTGVDLTATATL